MNRELREKIKLIIKNSVYKDKINCILQKLERININSWDDLQNLPRLGHFCGVDIYQLLAILNENWDKELMFTASKRSKKSQIDVANEKNDPLESEGLLTEETK